MSTATQAQGEFSILKIESNLHAAVIFDMDGTLADCSHRLRYVEGPGKKNWDKFFAGCAEDRPRVEIIKLALDLAVNNSIVIATGRPKQLLKVTEQWLKKYEVPFEKIYMRQNDDRRSDGVVKREMLEQMHHDGFAPWLVVDDRDTAVSAWREMGLCCLQCDESRY